MTSRVLLLCVVALVCVFPMPGAAAQGVKSEQEILVQLEQDWDEAFHRNDVRFIEPILADEFVVTYGDGTRGDKAKELELAIVEQPIESSSLDEFIVKVYRDTAVVWFTQHLVGQSKGQTLELTFRYVDVFVFRAGRWQCVASQSTRLSTN
jgi:ketosteroid isomerase-like protein